MIRLGRYGAWSTQLRFGDPGLAAEVAAELEELGLGTLWIPGGLGGDVLADARRLLAATRRIPVATGIVNIWAHEPADIAVGTAALRAGHGPRFLLGLGVSHDEAVRPMGHDYARPLARMSAFLDGLDTAPEPVAREDRIVAALGPRMLDLAGARSAGTHPYFTPVEHTAAARERLGPGPVVAPEIMAVLDPDPAAARETARPTTARYLDRRNYVNNLRRSGWTDGDLAGAGSDALVDAIVAHGDADAIRARADEHLAAGADHVCIQLLTPEGTMSQRWREGWRRLAASLS